MPPTRMEEQQNAASSQRVWEQTGFTQKLLLDLTEKGCRMIIDILMNLEQCRLWLEQASATMFFLLPKNVTGERPIALLAPTLIWWLEWWRAPLLQWSSRRNMTWDATERQYDGSDRTAMRMWIEKCDITAKELDEGAFTSGVDLAKCSRVCSWNLSADVADSLRIL